MENKAHFCLASFARSRALMGIFLPFMWLVAWVTILSKRGYMPWQYFSLLSTGEISLLGQLLMWIALFYWIARYWPNAIEALSGNHCMIWRNNDSIYFANGNKIKLADISYITINNNMLGKYITFHLDSSLTFRLAVLFSDVGQATLTGALKSIIEDARPGGAALT